MSQYCLIQNVAGTLLNAVGGELSATADADDTCLWQREDDHLVHVASRLRLISEPVEAEGVQCMTLEDGAPVEGAPFHIVEGPQQTPSSHLDELRSQGFTVVRHVMDDAAIARLKAGISRERAEYHAHETSHDGSFWIVNSLIWSVEVARAASHPVALWIIRQYMRTEEIHFCHQPVITTVKPADLLAGTFPDDGWHTDYPYHPKLLPEDFHGTTPPARGATPALPYASAVAEHSPAEGSHGSTPPLTGERPALSYASAVGEDSPAEGSWPEHPPLGVQFNICVDAFRADNAATQYVPGSHLSRTRPPRDFNVGGTRMGHGLHAGVRQWLAPAGAAIIYDARMWHRACNELNASGRDRSAILNAVAPSWVRPMMDKTALAGAFPGSPAADGLNERERAEIERLCCRPTRPTPAGMPRLNPRRPDMIDINAGKRNADGRRATGADRKDRTA